MELAPSARLFRTFFAIFAIGSEHLSLTRQISDCKAQLLRSYARFWTRDTEGLLAPHTLGNAGMPSLVSHLHKLLAASVRSLVHSAEGGN